MKLKVLIADDSKVFQKIITSVVTAGGHEVIACANDGAEALNIYKSKGADIVLLDITMPNMSGKQCLAEIIKLNKAAKVAMISALTDPEMEKECRSLGASGFISKSLCEIPNALQDAILKLIDKISAQ